MDKILQVYRNKLNPGEKLNIDFESGEISTNRERRKIILGNLYKQIPDPLPINTVWFLNSDIPDQEENKEKKKVYRKNSRTRLNTTAMESVKFFSEVKMSSISDKNKKRRKIIRSKKVKYIPDLGDKVYDTNRLRNSDEINKKRSMTMNEKLISLGFERYNNRYFRDGIILQYYPRFDTITFPDKIHHMTKKKLIKDLGL